MHALTPPPCVLRHAPRRGAHLARSIASRRTSAAAASKGAAVLSERVSQALRGTLLFVVGDNTAANAKLCDVLAASLGCGQYHWGGVARHVWTGADAPSLACRQLHAAAHRAAVGTADGPDADGHRG
jgi:hypothetical protein